MVSFFHPFPSEMIELTATWLQLWPLGASQGDYSLLLAPVEGIKCFRRGRIVNVARSSPSRASIMLDLGRHFPEASDNCPRWSIYFVHMVRIFYPLRFSPSPFTNLLPSVADV